MSRFKLGVLSGEQLKKVFNDAKKNRYALLTEVASAWR